MYPPSHLFVMNPYSLWLLSKGYAGAQILWQCSFQPVDRGGLQTQPSLARSSFHHLCHGQIVPGTRVDSTLQVLSSGAHASTFVPTAQTPELPGSPL